MAQLLEELRSCLATAAAAASSEGEEAENDSSTGAAVLATAQAFCLQLETFGFFRCAFLCMRCVYAAAVCRMTCGSPFATAN